MENTAPALNSAEKAFEAASLKVEAPKAANAVEAKVAAVAKARPAAKKVAAKAPAAKKVAAAKPVKTAKTVTAKKTAISNKTVKAAKAAAPVTLRQKLANIVKDSNMDKKIENAAEDFTARVQDMYGDATVRAKAAYEKGTEVAAKGVEFTKANVEAVVESGKILAAGMKDMGQGYVADGKSNFETFQADVKKLTAVKSPTEFFQLQSEMLRKGFDIAVAQTSKNTETTLKLVSDAFQPISNRVSAVIEDVKKAA